MNPEQGTDNNNQDCSQSNRVSSRGVFDWIISKLLDPNLTALPRLIQLESFGAALSVTKLKQRADEVTAVRGVILISFLQTTLKLPSQGPERCTAIYQELGPRGSVTFSMKCLATAVPL